MTNKVDTRLSYSSATLLKNCSMKYWHHKVNNTPKDADSSENEEAFNVGKAFHWVLEENGHTENNLDTLLSQAVKAFEVEEFQGMIHAMLLRYLQVHKKSGLSVVKCELGMDNEIFIGFIDVILKDADDFWWISDLKTASRLSDTKIASLPKDPQLNLYSAFAEQIAGLLDLDYSKWKGARYRVTTKSKLTKKITESYSDHVKRTAKNVKSYDIVIPREQLNPQAAWADHERLHGITLKLRSGEIKPQKNLSYCDSFFKPCEFWSQCHGSTFTKCSENLNMVTSDNV